jgi:hypothetical protein
MMCFGSFVCLSLQVDVNVLFFPPMAPQPIVGQGLLIVKASQSHSVRHTTLVGLLGMNDQPDAETTRNPQSQQASGRTPTP